MQPWEGGWRPWWTLLAYKDFLVFFSHLPSLPQQFSSGAASLPAELGGSVLAGQGDSWHHPSPAASLPCLPRWSHQAGASCGLLLRNHLLTHPSLACLSEIMPAFKNLIAALHDTFIHFFHCHKLLQISSCEVFGKDNVGFFPLLQGLRDRHYFFSACWYKYKSVGSLRMFLEMLGTCFLHHNMESDRSVWARFGLGASTVEIFSCCAKIGGIIYIHLFCRASIMHWIHVHVH